MLFQLIGVLFAVSTLWSAKLIEVYINTASEQFIFYSAAWSREDNDLFCLICRHVVALGQRHFCVSDTYINKLKHVAGAAYTQLFSTQLP